MERLRRKEFLNIPNYITFIRVIAIPVLVIFMELINDRVTTRHAWNLFWSFMAALTFSIAGLSDIVDGFFARRYNISSAFGKFLDPVADKLLNLSAMIMLIALHRIMAWLVILLLIREVGVTGLRGVAANEQIVIAASKWGKYKNAFGSVAIALLILHYPIFGVRWDLIGWILLIISAGFSLGSGIHYTVRFFQEVKKRIKASPETSVL